MPKKKYSSSITAIGHTMALSKMSKPKWMYEYPETPHSMDKMRSTTIWAKKYSTMHSKDLMLAYLHMDKLAPAKAIQL